MKTFGTIPPNNYSIEDLYLTAPITWQLISGSSGMVVVDPENLKDAVTVQRASNTPTDFYDSDYPKINEDTGVYEYVLHRSIQHLFYNTTIITTSSVNGYSSAYFYSGSVLSTASLAGFPDEVFVVSIGQQFYGDKIKPGSLQIYTELVNKYIEDDEYGNLYVSQSGTVTYIGNVFYDKGIAVIKHDTGSVVTSVGPDGLKLVDMSELYVNYQSDLKKHRHEIYVNLDPSEFNFSLFNPTIVRTFQPSGVSASLFTASMQQEGIQPANSSNDTYNLYTLMSNGVIKPYVTTIGLYNERYELLAVAKLSEPIQRTFNTNQIFIVRFDTE